MFLWILLNLNGVICFHNSYLKGLTDPFCSDFRCQPLLCHISETYWIALKLGLCLLLSTFSEGWNPQGTASLLHSSAGKAVRCRLQCVCFQYLAIGFCCSSEVSRQCKIEPGLRQSWSLAKAQCFKNSWSKIRFITVGLGEKDWRRPKWAPTDGSCALAILADLAFFPFFGKVAEMCD